MYFLYWILVVSTTMYITSQDVSSPTEGAIFYRFFILISQSLRPSHVLSGTMIIFGIFSVSVAAAKNASTLIV
jgi:hypothetical protein